MMLTDLADVLRDAGLEVIEEPGWKQRGHGPMVNVLGVTCHHTGNGGAGGLEPSRDVVRDGRPGLDGPLAQLLLRKDGRFRVIAAGLCYHAGASRSKSMTNSHRIGIEAEAKGVPGTIGDWPKVQMDAYARGCWALSQHYRFDVSQVLGHKETCDPIGRKSDPDFGMNNFRALVRAAGKPPLPQKEANMAIADADIDRIWNEDQKLTGQAPAGVLSELDKRSAAANLQLQARLGVDPLIKTLQAELAQVKAQAASNGGQLSNLTTQVAAILKLLAPPPA